MRAYWPGWRRYEGSEYQPEKMICDDIERIPDEFARLIRQMCDPAFLRMLEEVACLLRRRSGPAADLAEMLVHRQN